MECEPTHKVTLHCIGLCVPCDTLGPCLLMMEAHKECRIYCLSLTKQTADLISPLYEHSLMIKKGVANASLSHFVDESIFTILERRGCAYRLDAQYTRKELEKKMIELIGRTLFIEMDRCYSVKPEANQLLKPFFLGAQHCAFLNCDEYDEDKNTLNAYLEIYKEVTEKKYRNRKTLYENFWKEVALKRPQHQNAVERAVQEHLLRYVAPKGATLYQRENILLMFKGWNHYKAIAPYFFYRVQSMDETYTLYKMLKYDDTLMARLTTLSYTNCRYLFSFCNFLKRLIMTASTDQSSVNLKRQDLPPVAFFEEVLPGHLSALLGTLAAQYEQEGSKVDITHTLLYPLIALCLLIKLEAQCHARALYNKATIEPLVVQTVYAAYHSLVTPDTAPKLSEEATFTLEADEEQDEFGIVLARLCELLKRECVSNEKWHSKERKAGTVIKANTPLFFYAPNTVNLTLETQHALLCEKYIMGKGLISLRFHEREPIEENEWQDEWAEVKETMKEELQQFNLVLFSASEVKQNKDLECIKTLLFADLNNTVILRESADVFFHRRISHYFAETQNELRMDLFHKEHCFELAGFDALPEKALKETIIVPQCHTLSLTAMKNLLQLAIYYQNTIKRVVLIGAPFILPLETAGQAFLDLLRVLTPKDIVNSIYQKEERAQEFATLLNKHWRLINTEQKNAKQYAQHFKEGGYSCLYSLKQEDALCEYLPTSSTPSLTIYCLYRAQALNCAGRSRNFLFDSLSAKQKAGKVFQSMEIDELARHDCIAKSNALFIINHKTLLQLDKNQLLHLFLLLDCLYVIDNLDKKTDILESLIELFKERKKPNLKYSHIVLTK